jgi:hypothetical protein
MRLTFFKLLSQINAINNCDFLKVMISVTGGHCDYLPLASPVLSILVLIQ